MITSAIRLALLLLAPPAPAPAASPPISLTLSTTSTANGPQAPGQSFSMSMNYQWSNAPSGQHQLTVSFTVPQALEIVNSSTPLGGNPNGIRTVVRSFNTVTSGPFNASSNTSGSGSFTLTLRFRAGVPPGTQACVAPSLREGNGAGPSSQRCFTSGGSGPGGSGTGGGTGGGTGNPGSGSTAVSHWAITHDLADGTGVAASTAIFRVTLVNATPSAAGEPGLVAPSISYSVINPAKIVAVSQGVAPGSGLPPGWSLSGGLPSPFITVTGPATLAPTAALPVLYVHVSLAGVPLGGTNQGMASLTYRLSSDPQSAPKVLGDTKSVRVVTVLK